MICTFVPSVRVAKAIRSGFAICWKGSYSKHDPGLVYSRGDCSVAVVVTRKDRAVETQDTLIAHLKPRDNIQGQEEEVPF